MNSLSKNKLQQGFTLLELMLVTAIIGILTSLALPSYQAFVFRAKAAEVILEMDKIHTVLTALQAETGAKLGAEIRIMPNTVTSANPTSYPLQYCVLNASSRCDEIKPITGLSMAELTFSHLGVVLNVGSGADPFSRKDGDYKLSVNEDYNRTGQDPALRTTAQQTILAVHHVMAQHTYRPLPPVINPKSESHVYLYVNLQGTRP
jgi:prepilin-type N-terminal cleavage/methylation domain-containing protein